MIAALLAGCLNESPDQYPINPEPPSLVWPTTWTGVDRDEETGELRQIIVIMTVQEHRKLRDEIAQARNWMRQAGHVLQEQCGYAQAPEGEGQ